MNGCPLGAPVAQIRRESTDRSTPMPSIPLFQRGRFPSTLSTMRLPTASAGGERVGIPALGCGTIWRYLYFEIPQKTCAGSASPLPCSIPATGWPQNRRWLRRAARR